VNKHPVKGEDRVRVLFDALLELGGVQPDDAVLDIGCGGGHFAAKFTTYLSDRGSYEGLDVRPGFIHKAIRRVASDHPNFHFHVAEVYNTYYNPEGTVKADNYRLPYEDDSFDFVYGLSLFTHMMPAEVQNYLYDTARVLKPGGRSFFTYLLLNEEARAAIDAGRTGPDARLPHDRGDYRVKSEEVPESQVALDEGLVKSFYADVGLSIVEPVLYGDWTGRSETITRQDIVLAEKRSGSAS
jgi:ubiquinone/menaquinone biosynthesis C-methylase UbiE